MKVISYADECAYRREVCDPLIVPQPPAPAAPEPLLVLDENGEWQWHPDRSEWEKALAEWGALPAVRQNHHVRSAVEAALYVWRVDGVRYPPADLIADIHGTLAVLGWPLVRQESTKEEKAA